MTSEHAEETNDEEIEEKARKEYNCQLCGKNFVDRRRFSEHFRNAHGETLWPCSFPNCGQREFKTHFTLLNHIISDHTDFVCPMEECGKGKLSEAAKLDARKQAVRRHTQKQHSDPESVQEYLNTLQQETLN